MEEAMFQDEKKTNVKSLTDDLEPYRQLVELQKQMIELARQHEKTKSECAAIRERLLKEMTKRRHSRWNWHGLIGRPAGDRAKNLAAPWKPRMEKRPYRTALFVPRIET